ncbi:MAG: hypothetical protein O3A92_15085, partial [Verrucomicrobia bacterium]|nr:hypothetical protein [Verrucomicrobiota bacterium]
MSALSRSLRCLVWMAGMGLGGVGGEELPAAPAGHVLDEAGLFDRHPEELAVISGRLLALQEEHELPVYLAIYGGLMHTGIGKQTRQLYDAWIGKGSEGVVVVWDSDSDRLEFGLPTMGYYDLGGESPAVARLPEHRLRPIMVELRTEMAERESKQEAVDRLSVVLATRLDWLLEDTAPRRGISPGKVAAATLVLGG